MKRLGKEANVSFAAIAVLIFLGAVMAQAYLSTTQMQEAQRREDVRDMQRMASFASECYSGIRAKARFASVSAVILGRQTGADPEHLFREDMENYLVASYPRRDGLWEASIDNSSWEMVLERASFVDAVPVVDSETIMVKGKGPATSIGTDRNSVVGEAGTPLTTSARGALTIRVVGPKSEFVIEREMGLPLDETYPFLMDRMTLLQANMDGDATATARLVQYILTTLVQYKVLQGEASPASQTTVLDLLTPWELEMAVNLAVYLVELRAFRAIDPDSLKEFDEMNAPLVAHNATMLVEKGIIASARERSMERLVQRYLVSGEVDAADLLALFLCLDKEHIAIDKVIAQSLYTVLDQLVLKFMDYLSIPDLGGGNAATLNDAQRFSNRYLGQMGVGTNIRVVPEEFQTDEIVTSYKNSTRMHHSVLEEGRVFHGTGALITSLARQNIPPIPIETHNLPVPQKTFYVNGASEASLSLSMKAIWENATINVSLHARPEGGEWAILSSWSGGEEGHLLFQEKFVLGSAKEDWEIELRIEMAATSINTSSNFEIVKLASEQRYEGQWINRSFLSRRPATYSQSTSMAAARELQNNPGLFGGFSAAFKDIVHSFFTHIVQAVSEMICDLLFGSRRPVLRIDPLDGDSIIETTRQTTISWVTVGFNRLRLLLRDDDFVINACKQVMKDIMAGLAEVVKGVLTGFLNAVGDFIERAMDWLISGFCSVIGAIGGFAADAIEFFTFGLVQADGIRDTVSSLVKGAESYWEAFKNTIKGVIQGFLEVVYQVIDNIAEMVGEVIGAILGRLAILFRGLIDAFLISARTVIIGLVDYMLVGSAVSAVEYRETMVKAGQSLDVGEFVFEGENSTKSFQVEISQDPKYLSRYDPRFIMEVGAPKGMHYTAANSISNHPYETTWEVLVIGEVWVNASSGGSPLAEMNGLSNISSCIFLNVSVPITVFSGWPLRGAEYKASNTLLEDLKTLFQLAWEKLTSVFEGIIHFIKKAADLFSRLIQEILSRAMQLVEMLESVFEKAMDLFAKLLTGMGYKIARELLHLFLGDNDQLGPITVFGFTLLIVVRQTTDAAWLNVSLSREGGGFGAWANLSEDDASLHAHMAFWNLRASGTITSFVNREYNGFVEWNDNGRGWLFDFHGPKEVEYAEATVSLASTTGRGWVVPTPAGPATVDVGVVLRMDMARIEGTMLAELGSLGAMLMEGPGRVMERLHPREDIEGTSELARGVAEFAFSGDPLDRLERTLLNVSDAMVLEMFLDISLGAGIGPGCRLSILIYDPIMVLSELIPWLLSVIGGAVSGLLGEAGTNAGGRMTYSPPSRGLSRHAMESIALRLKVYGGSDSLGREMSFGIEANLPLFGELAGADWGDWRISLDLSRRSLVGVTGMLDHYKTSSLFYGDIREMKW